MPDSLLPPLSFAFGLHAHQPEGNFGHVFQEHLRDVYRPFLDHAVAGDFLPLTLHFSGPLLEWLKAHDAAYLDRVGRLAAEGRVELLLAGYYEPILPSLTREDRIQQVLWMREALQELFGVDARGLWLTERVWEPDLPADLVAAGVDYVLVDDRHFVAAGFQRDRLHAPFRTEASGKSLSVFPIDEKLRYHIPFQPPEATASYLRELREKHQPLAIFADDIEKFGGWPGTREWVYEKGWLDRFMRTLSDLRESGEIRLLTFRQALEEVPSGGPAYLPSASYREMEEWSLPPEAFHRLEELKEVLGEERFERGESPLIRGSHWRNFLVKYPEANRMHKKMTALSALCRERGDPVEARKALGRAQCNDAYWHGVFGGLYLRHLRDTVWRNLAEAEGRLRGEEGMTFEVVDADLDGHEEIRVHSNRFSAVVSPHRGGGVEELTLFGSRVNLANTLTRRREAYHEVRGASSPEGGESQDEGTPSSDHAPSIHDLEDSLIFSELPPVDPDERAIFLERILSASVTEEAYRNGTYRPLRNWAGEPVQVSVLMESSQNGAGPEGEAAARQDRAVLLVRMEGQEDRGRSALEKVLRFQEDGTVEAHFRWDPTPYPEDAWFTSEISLGAEAVVESSPGGETWQFPISTFSKSERGFDETVQGESVLTRWPVGLGQGWIRISERP